MIVARNYLLLLGEYSLFLKDLFTVSEDAIIIFKVNRDNDVLEDLVNVLSNA